MWPLLLAATMWAMLCLPPNAQGNDLPRWAPLSVPIFLIVANPAVQEELRLSVKQRTEIAALVKDVNEIYRGWSKLDWNVRDQKTLTAQIMTGHRLGKVLKEEQLERLAEIDRQRRGAAIICDDRASAPLKLSREQREKLEILAEMTMLASVELEAKLANTNPKDAPGHRKMVEELIKCHADGNVKVEAELSEEQKTAWRSIRGKPFDVRLLLQSRPTVVD